jgi:hypothetical protein
VPISLGDVEEAGDAGAVADKVGAPGADRSLTNERAELQTDVLPALSVAVARI